MIRKLNIAIACSYPITTERIGGMDYFFWQIDQELKNTGYAVEWLFSSHDSTQHYEDKGINFDVVQNNNQFQEELLVWLQSKKEIGLFVGHFLDYQSSIVKSIKKALGTSVPCVYVDHMSRASSQKPFLFRLKKRIKGWYYYRYIDKIIGVSRFVKKSILCEIGYFWDSKTMVIYNGIRTENYELEFPDATNSPLTIFCIGHLIKEKGFQTVILCCELLQHQNIPFHLIIAGDGNYKHSLLDLAHAFLKPDSFTFVGNITNTSYWFQKAEIVIIPSLWEEAFGFTVVESVLTKTVTFASNVGAIPEILSDNELLFTPNDEKELAQLLQNYLKDKKYYQSKMKALGERVLQEFTIEKMVEQHVACYQSFLKQ